MKRNKSYSYALTFLAWFAIQILISITSYLCVQTYQHLQIPTHTNTSTDNFPNLIVVKSNDTINAMMNNDAFFKHNHENDTLKFCTEFNVIYLCQGRSLFT
eukprot:192172_1